MHRRAFTLMELMLVVIIVGVVYAMSISGLQRQEKKSFELNLMNLDVFLDKFREVEDVALICTDACRKCGVYADGKKVDDVKPFLDTSVEIYRFDMAYGTREMRWPSLFDEDGREEEVCFRYDRFKDGSETEMIVVQKDEAILFPGYFGTAKRFATLEDLLQSRQRIVEEATE